MTVDPVSAGIMIALTAAQMALTASQHYEGPRVTDLKATSADYGTPLNNFYGKRVMTCPVMFAEDLVDRERNSKSKGGKQTSHYATGTCAVHVADHCIGRVTRIWADEHLIYDADAEQQTFSFGDDFNLLDNMRIYTGTCSQEPDPRMLATIEALEGVGTCPAYRFQSYIFFEDIPLDLIGNRYPQWRVEAEAMSTYHVLPVWDKQPFIENIYNGEIAFWGLSPNGRYALGAISTPNPNYTGIGPDKSETQRAQNPFILTMDLQEGVIIGPYSIIDLWVICGQYFDVLNSSRLIAIDNDGNIFTTDGYQTLYKCANFGDDDPVAVASIAGPEALGPSVWTFTTSDGDNLLLVFGQLMPNFAEQSGDPEPGFINRFPDADQDAYIYNIDTESLSAPVLHSDTGEDFFGWLPFIDAYDDIWIVGSIDASSNAYFWRVRNSGNRPLIDDIQIVPGLDLLDVRNNDTTKYYVGKVSGAAHFAGSGKYFISWDNGGWYYLIDEETFLVTDSLHNDHKVRGPNFGWTNVPIDRTDLWIAGEPYLRPEAANNNAYGFNRISGDDLTTLESKTPTDWCFSVEDGDGECSWWWAPMERMMFSYQYQAIAGFWEDGGSFDDLGPGYRPIILYYDELRLRHVLLDLSERAGLAQGVDCNYYDLDHPMKGFSWTHGTIKQIAGYLPDVYDCDIVPHDFQIIGKKRGGASQGVLATSEFARRLEDAGERYTVPVTNDRDLPRDIYFTFADYDADQNPNTAEPPARMRSAVVSERVLPVDGQALAMTASEAKESVARYHRRLWFSRKSPEFGLTRRRLGIEPGDVWTPEFDGVTLIARCTKETIGANGIIKTVWAMDNPALAGETGAEGAPAAGHVPSVVFDPSPTIGEVLDIPLLTDAHDQAAPFVYVVAGPAVDDKPWNGSTFSQSDTGSTGSFGFGWDSLGSSSGTIFGVASELGDWDPEDGIDDGAGFSVVLKSGTLTSSTEGEVLANGLINQFALASADGYEIGQFITATLTDDLTYTVTDIVRGCRGTEQHIAGHSASDRFIMLNNAKVHTIGAAEIGDTDYYIASTSGQNPDEGAAQSLTFAANAHRPYSPVDVTVVKVGSDWTVDGTGRARIGGPSATPPTGEAYESWELDIMDGATVVRTIEATSLPIVYDDAAATLDFGTNPATLTVNLYQFSPALGIRGFGTEASG